LALGHAWISQLTLGHSHHGPSYDFTIEGSGQELDLEDDFTIVEFCWRCGNIEMLFYTNMSWKPQGGYEMLILMMQTPNCMLTLQLTMWQIGGILICLWQYASKSPFNPIDDGLLTQKCWP
jgi:hypothetical protein